MPVAAKGPGKGAGVRPASQDDLIRMMLLAHPNIGKSHLIGSGAAAGWKTLIIRPYTDTLPIYTLGSGAQEWEVHNWNEMLDDVLPYLRNDGQEWDWVWLDSVSGWQDVGLDDVFADVVAEKPGRRKFSYDKGEYRINMDRLSMWIRAVVGCRNFHFGFSAWPFEMDDPFEEDQGTILMPWIQGRGMPQKFCGYTNFAGYMEVKENKEGKKWRRMHVNHTQKAYVKDQFGAFPKGYVDEPTMPKIVQAIDDARRSAGLPITRQPSIQSAARRPAGRGRR